MRYQFDDYQTERRRAKQAYGGRKDRKYRMRFQVRSRERVAAWMMQRQFNECSAVRE